MPAGSGAAGELCGLWGKMLTEVVGQEGGGVSGDGGDGGGPPPPLGLQLSVWQHHYEPFVEDLGHRLLRAAPPSSEPLSTVSLTPHTPTASAQTHTLFAGLEPAGAVPAGVGPSGGGGGGGGGAAAAAAAAAVPIRPGEEGVVIAPEGGGGSLGGSPAPGSAHFLMLFMANQGMVHTLDEVLGHAWSAGTVGLVTGACSACVCVCVCDCVCVCVCACAQVHACVCACMCV